MSNPASNTAPARAVWGAGWGIVLGLIYAGFSLLDGSDVPFRRVVLSLVVGGAVGGALQGLLLNWSDTRMRAGAAMGAAASVGLWIVFYGWQYPDWLGLGVLVGIAAGLTYGVLIWRDPSDARG